MCQKFNNCYNILSDIICSIICSWHSQTQDGKQHTRTLFWRKVSCDCQAEPHPLATQAAADSALCMGWHDVSQSPASLVMADWTKNWCLTQRLWYSGCPIANETGWCRNSAQRGHCILDDDWPIKQSLFHTIWIWDLLGVLSGKIGQKWADTQRGVQIPWLQAVGAVTQHEQWSRERTTESLWRDEQRKQRQCRWVTILAKQ